MRRRLLQHGFGADRDFRWRGGEISRLEGLSDAVFWSGMAYMLIMPLQIVNGRMMGARIRRAATTSAGEPSAT